MLTADLVDSATRLQALAVLDRETRHHGAPALCLTEAPARRAQYTWWPTCQACVIVAMANCARMVEAGRLDLLVEWGQADQLVLAALDTGDPHLVRAALDLRAVVEGLG